MKDRQGSKLKKEHSQSTNQERINAPKVGLGKTETSFEDVLFFIKKVGLAAHKYGSTSARLESFLNELSNRFGYNGVFRSNPTEIIFAISQKKKDPQRVEVVATTPPGLDLDKLARLGDVLQEFNLGKLPLSAASKKIDEIDEIQPPWGKFAGMLGYAFVGLGLAPLLGGGWMDALFATVFSVLVYGMVLLTSRLGQAAAEWLPLTTAFVVGVFATLVKYGLPELNVVLVILSAIAILLPGYTISLGVGELVGQRVVSGTANLMNGLVCLIKQIVGGSLGVVLVTSLIPGITSSPSIPVSKTWVYALFVLLLVGLNFSFQVSKRDFIWALLVSIIAYVGTLAGSSLLDANLGNLLGTILAVVISNIWAKQTGRPTSVVLIPAIVMLVSGTIGFRGLASLAAGDIALGMQQFIQMFVVALTIFSGILIGFTIVKPEKTF